MLKDQNLVEGDLSLTFPHGERRNGFIYSGLSNWGWYYQIKLYGRQTFPEYLKKGDTLLVIVLRSGRQIHAILENEN